MLIQAKLINHRHQAPFSTKETDQVPSYSEETMLFLIPQLTEHWSGYPKVHGSNPYCGKLIIDRYLALGIVMHRISSYICSYDKIVKIFDIMSTGD